MLHVLLKRHQVPSCINIFIVKCILAAPFFSLFPSWIHSYRIILIKDSKQQDYTFYKISAIYILLFIFYLHLQCLIFVVSVFAFVAGSGAPSWQMSKIKTSTKEHSAKWKFLDPYEVKWNPYRRRKRNLTNYWVLQQTLKWSLLNCADPASRELLCHI